MDTPQDTASSTSQVPASNPSPTPEATTPCCGTREAATAAGACCDPAAKASAVAAGAGCC